MSFNSDYYSTILHQGGVWLEGRYNFQAIYPKPKIYPILISDHQTAIFIEDDFLPTSKIRIGRFFIK